MSDEIGRFLLDNFFSALLETLLHELLASDDEEVTAEAIDDEPHLVAAE